MITSEEALKYHKLGYAPIPVSQDKKPDIRGWRYYQDIQPDSELVQRWFHTPELQRWSPYPNEIALVVGKHYRFVVLDVGPGEDLDRLTRKYSIPTTVVSCSGGGTYGFHLYFKYPKGANLKNVPSCKFKENMAFIASGLTVVPPSMRQSDKKYSWTRSIFDHEMAELPLELLVFFR